MAVGVVAVLWSIWKTRNSVCFQSKFPTNPTQVMFVVCHWIDYCSRLQKGNRLETLKLPSRRLWRVAAEAFNRRQGWSCGVQRLHNG